MASAELLAEFGPPVDLPTSTSTRKKSQAATAAAVKRKEKSPTKRKATKQQRREEEGEGSGERVCEFHPQPCDCILLPRKPIVPIVAAAEPVQHYGAIAPWNPFENEPTYYSYYNAQEAEDYFIASFFNERERMDGSLVSGSIAFAYEDAVATPDIVTSTTPTRKERETTEESNAVMREIGQKSPHIAPSLEGDTSSSADVNDNAPEAASSKSPRIADTFEAAPMGIAQSTVQMPEWAFMANANGEGKAGQAQDNAISTNGDVAVALSPIRSPRRSTLYTDVTQPEEPRNIPCTVLEGGPTAAIYDSLYPPHSMSPQMKASRSPEQDGLTLFMVEPPLVGTFEAPIDTSFHAANTALNVPSDGQVDADAAQYLLQLPQQTGLPANSNGATEDPFVMDADGYDYSTFHQVPEEAGGATGFAKLEFLDGYFYMATYAIDIGRDVKFSHRMRKLQAQAEAREAARTARSSSVPGTPAHHPLLVDGAGSYARSFQSDGGGIVNDEDSHIGFVRHAKKGRKSHSTGESSRRSQTSRKNSISQTAQSDVAASDAPNPTVDPNVTAPLNPLTHMPDVHFIPSVPLRAPKTESDPFPQSKGISKKHLRIYYNFERGIFEMSVHGRNGAFHDEVHWGAGSVIALHDNSHIAVGDVHFHFKLPNAHLSEYETTVYEDPDLGSQSGRMSFSFEDGRGESIIADDDSVIDTYESVEEQTPHPNDLRTWQELNDPIESDEEEEGDDEGDESEEVEEAPKVRLKLKAKVPSRRKGTKYRKKGKLVQPPKVKIRMGGKHTAKEKAIAKAKADAEAREREIQAAKEQKLAKAKEIAQEKAAKAAKEKEAAKQAAEALAKEASMSQPPKDSGTEEGKTPKEPAAPRIARDAPMENGTEITIAGLPAGVIIPPRKKGPGRPPKDGVMSKREKALLVKQNKEKEKAIKLGLDPSLVPMPEEKPPKPRPRKNSQGEEIDAGGSGGEGQERKISKTPKPPRSPSPEMRIEDYSEEQLQRPTPNYVYLIYEAIENSKTKVLNLQQIYSAIERRYPFFRFKVTSTGWQSSVRHNLGQHDAFVKVEKEGKGWLWGIKEGVPIERERKKKTPPPQTPPHYGHPPYGQHYPHPAYGSYPPSTAPPGYPQQNPQFQQQRHPSGTSLVPPSLAGQALRPPPSLAPPAGSTTGQQTQTYSSPYARDNGTNQAARPGAPNGAPGSVVGQPGHSGPPYHPNPPAYANRPSQEPGRSTTPPGPQGSSRPHGLPTHGLPPHRPRWQRPAQDVIDTFKRVFIRSMSGRDQNIDGVRAEEIVNNAITRVLEPDKMAHIPPNPTERAVTEAFEKVVAQSQGPPRQVAPGLQVAPPPTGATNVAASAVSAAMNAAATAGTGPSQSGGPGPATTTARIGNGLGIDMGSLPSSAAATMTSTIARSKSPSQPPPHASTASAPGAAQLQPQPQRPAQFNLMNMLMGGAPAGTPPPPPPQTSASPVPPTAAVPASVPASNIPASAPVPAPNTALPAQISQLLKHNGTSTPTRPSMEPLTPPMVKTSPVVGTKRQGSPLEGDNAEGKKARVDE
ncbi:hypothetical protein EJ08DRAFT_355819 [Tothia fuscella]|uniref:Fork-head domain-containing protein n=1 Tax=Tothia fuscella TaxID=1048955 RepID=A0A9P4NM50_9PEZI|nr:hypothetical protein EJ08DRAFT_355819 [Tothia fuscella]